MNLQKYIITLLILVMSTTIISCNSLRSNDENKDNEKQELQEVEENKQLLNEISSIRNELQTLKNSIANKTNTNDNTSSLATPNVLPSIANMVEVARPGVVSIVISSTQNTFFGRQDSDGAGSGIIISEDGYILTNSHVVDLANTITVSFYDETQSEAELIGQDPLTDLAVIKVDKSGLKPLSISPNNNLRVGDWVVAIGNAIGLEGEPTVTLGIVSALERELAIDSTYLTELIQTDAVINPGNSGGPIINEQGELVGIASAGLNKLLMAKKDKYIPENVNFAVATPIIVNLLKNKKIKYTTGSYFSSNYSGTELAEIGNNSTLQLLCYNTKVAYMQIKNSQKHRDVLFDLK